MVATETGPWNSAHVLDSTPIFDAVATEDTVTQLRASIRKVLGALDQAKSPLAASVSAALVETTTMPQRASRRMTGTTGGP